jgi:DNA-directed RNA polymerase subunit RPC12/RpoP
MADRKFPCARCGADLAFEPGVQEMACPYCGHRQPVPATAEAVEELDFTQHLRRAEESAETDAASPAKCAACGAEVALAVGVASDACPYCGGGVTAEAATRRRIRPRALLPFRVSRGDAQRAFHQWIRTRWFAPNDLKRYAGYEKSLQGVYVPYWTYDCLATSQYTGERGDDYWATETYTTMQGGRPVTRTRQVRRTAWRPVSGAVQDAFDDVLVLASANLPRKQAVALEPWDLADLTPYADEYVSGFRVEQYQRGLEEGFAEAREIMAGAIRQHVCRDIGGDHQRIHSLRTQYRDITFKHVLLPVWMSAYLWRQRTYRFLVNARTAEVQGERPWSWVKIAAALAALSGLVALIAHC